MSTLKQFIAAPFLVLALIDCAKLTELTKLVAFSKEVQQHVPHKPIEHVTVIEMGLK